MEDLMERLECKSISSLQVFQTVINIYYLAYVGDLDSSIYNN